MGNLCSILSSQFKQENKHNTSIPIVTPLYYPDISGNVYDSELRYSNHQNYINNHNMVYGTPVYNNNNSIPNANANSQNQQPIVIIQQQPGYYNDPGIGIMNGMLTGMIIGDMLDDDCY